MVVEYIRYTIDPSRTEEFADRSGQGAPAAAVDALPTFVVVENA
jgi:hypothetical protein